VERAFISRPLRRREDIFFVPKNCELLVIVWAGRRNKEFWVEYSLNSRLFRQAFFPRILCLLSRVANKENF
jgi:hypothetical protein